MTWIKKHWEPEFITIAETNIRKTVSFINFYLPSILKVILTYPLQDG
jgi:hypothetical protein